MSYTFDFAISFSRECRSQARKLTELLVDQGANVFYDHSYLEHLLGKHLDDELGWMFGSATRFFVPFVSAGYTRRPWPQYEWSIAKLEAERRQEEFILPLRVDDSHLVGLLDTVGYLDLRDHELPQVAELLMRKLDRPVGPIGAASQERELVVTFGLKMEDLEATELPADASSDVPMLYEWLIDDLVHRLTSEGLPRIRVIEDSRTGETLSVRLGFAWEPAKGALSFGEMEWWDLLELVPYEDLYGSCVG